MFLISGFFFPVFDQGSIEQATFNVEPRSRTVREGERVELLCAAFGFPRAVLRWQKNGSDIPSHATDLERLILRFEQVRTSDAGQYRCKATQFFGVVYSKEATLSGDFSIGLWLFLNVQLLPTTWLRHPKARRTSLRQYAIFATP